jgi:hypothetical protein
MKKGVGSALSRQTTAVDALDASATGQADQIFASRQVARIPQLDMFDSLLPAERSHPYSNSFALYDLAPKYVFHAEVRENGKYLPIISRPFEYGGASYEVEVRPARIKIDGAEKEYYPGEREQVVEEALRRIAIERRRTTTIDDSVGIRFSLYELRQELIRVGHAMPICDIKEAIEVAHLSNVVIRKFGGSQPMVSATIFPLRGVNEVQPNGDMISYVTFNPLVTEAIRSLDFRLINYELSMSLANSVARWLHKRLSHCYVQANSSAGTYNINATTIMRDSGMGSYTRERDAFRTIERAVAELKAKGVLTTYKATDVRGPRQRLTEVKYLLFPSPAFADEMKKANWAGKKLDEARAGHLKVVDNPPQRSFAGVGSSQSRIGSLPGQGATRR